jgi:hypothetical protein
MNATSSRILRHSVAGICACGLSAMLLVLGACHKTPADEKSAVNAKAPSEPAEAEEAAEGLSLKPEEVEKMGVVTTAATAAKHAPESVGFGVVLAHEAVAQAVADLATAVAVERQSQSAFERGKRLSGTPGAMPADTQESAERQAVVDHAALELVRRRQSSTFGQNPPWKNNERSPELLAVASGATKLVRVTFPLGSLGETHPAALRLAHISSGMGDKSWASGPVWGAPADASVPGKSFFALLKSSDVGEGERLLAWAPVGEAEDGVLIPAAAAVISNGQFWFYVEEKAGVFVKTALDTSAATNDGYFIKEGASPGDKIVTTAAGQLLARETNPSKEAE